MVTLNVQDVMLQSASNVPGRSVIGEGTRIDFADATSLISSATHDQIRITNCAIG